MQAGTGHDEFFRTDLDYLKKLDLWRKFTAIASLGVIHVFFLLFSHLFYFGFHIYLFIFLK
jgi:hypothetical protein